MSVSKIQDFDVVVIGGGVLGCAIGARLGATTARTAILEAANDVCEGASKGNAGNAVSYYGNPDSLQTALINQSSPQWEDICRRLDVPFRRIGALIVATTPDEVSRLEEIHQDIVACGARVTKVTPDEARTIEPLITENCLAALHLPDEGVIDPMRLTVAYAELAVANGVHLGLGQAVEDIEVNADSSFTLTTSKGTINTRFLVNAAGVSAGEISHLVSGEEYRSWPRQGQYVILDRAFGEQLNCIVFCTHGSTTHGTNVMPTAHGSVLLGPTARDLDNPHDKATEIRTLAELVDQAQRLVPTAGADRAIKTFAANRPASDEIHRLRMDAAVPHLMHATDRSTGVSTSPAGAELAVKLLNEAGLGAGPRSDAVTELVPIARLRDAADPDLLIEQNPLYGSIVCACEHVSSAEVVAALTSTVPANSIEGVRKRTCASYGRCQGSLCLAGLSFMTALHTAQDPAGTRQTDEGTIGR